MSYCRWSSDDWMCDLYVYEAEDGFYIHVASNKYVTEIPKVPGWNEVSSDEWFKAYQKQMSVVEVAESKPIGGIYDGQTFVCDTAQATLDKLKDIKEHGYNVPQFVFDSLQEEINEGNSLES